MYIGAGTQKSNHCTAVVSGVDCHHHTRFLTHRLQPKESGDGVSDDFVMLFFARVCIVFVEKSWYKQNVCLSDMS